MHCDQPCPTGTYGQFCMRNCTCQMENTLECSKEDGQCICERQYYGANCEHELNAFQLIMSSTTGQLVLVFACLSVGLAGLLLLVYRYRRAAEKRLRFLTARYSRKEAPNDSIYHIGTLPCTNKLRDAGAKIFDRPQDKLDEADRTVKVDEDQTSENLYESIDKFE